MAAGSLSIEQIGTYQDAFNKYCGPDGSCTSALVSSIMRSMGQNPSEAEIQDMVNQVDKDGTGMIDFPEFLMMMSLKADYEDAEDEIREAFQVFDGDGNGFINRNELACVMTNLGVALKAEEIQSMIDEADQDGDGQINYEEFYIMMQAV
eukprot:GFUD01083663.1.p1 GENE.GFUD01083663.1~~GFUD01083663.1.p1  ORF type:complete len:150 (-),score=49.87 GFUD01083663.1:52-501(-)